MDYGNAIRVARAARQLTQGELAAKIGIASSYVSLMETGRRKPGPDTVEALCRALRVPMHLFVLLGSDPQEVGQLDSDVRRSLGAELLGILVEVPD